MSSASAFALASATFTAVISDGSPTARALPGRVATRASEVVRATAAVSSQR
jgi:hypothetical protein